MAVTLPERILSQYRRFTLYNSPYDAHDRGCAVDLYPDAGVDVASSPVAGEVVDTRTVRAPPKPYAAENDHLIVVDTGERSSPSPHSQTREDCGDRLARILHVDPDVEPGDVVAAGDPLGELVRAGFFAPWVPNHVHLGFRPPDANPYRAAGSLPVEAAVDVRPLSWDGVGRVVEQGETYVVLDEPSHPDPGEYFVGHAAQFLDDVDGESGSGYVLDGGLPHYEGGGILPASSDAGATPTEASPVGLAGHRVGVLPSLRDEAQRASPDGGASGRDVAWDDLTVLANGEPITGISLFAARDEFGAKLICPERTFAVGECVTVSVRTE